MSKPDQKSLKVTPGAQNKRLQRLKRSDGSLSDAPSGVIVRQASAESNYSQPSSDPSLDDDGLRQRIQYNEQSVLQALETARTAYVEFTLRSNVTYDGSNEPEVPLRGRAISFSARDYIYVKAKFNEDWWIGQLVREGSDVGFVPTPSKLSGLSRRRAAKTSITAAPGIEATSASPTPTALSASGGKVKVAGSTPPSRDGKSSKPSTSSAPMSITPTGAGADDAAGMKIESLNAENDAVGTSTPVGGMPSTGPRSKKSTGAFFRKVELQPPYEVVPNMRPIMLIGPSLKGYDVTDMMQKAVFSRVKERLGDRVQVLRIKVDLTLAKRAAQTSAAGSQGNAGQRRGFDKVARSLGMQVADVQAEIESIFQAARLMRIIVVDCDTINHPSQLAKTGLAPIAVHLKIASAKVLQRLIKTRGKDRKNLSVQVTALENLNKCLPDSFDLVLDDNQFDAASHRLVDFLETYWRASHPPSMFGGAVDPCEQMRFFDEVHRPRMEKRDRERDAFSASNREQLLSSGYRDPAARSEAEVDAETENSPTTSANKEVITGSKRDIRRRTRTAPAELDEEQSAPASGSSSTHTQLTNVSGAASRRTSAQTHTMHNVADDEDEEEEDQGGEIPEADETMVNRPESCPPVAQQQPTTQRRIAAAPRYEDDEDDAFLRPGTHLVASRNQAESTRSGTIVA